MYTRSQIPLRSIRLRSIEERQPKHTRVLTVAGGVDLSSLDSTCNLTVIYPTTPFPTPRIPLQPVFGVKLA